MVEFASNWSKWLASSKDIPKLYINAEPGFFSPMILEHTKNWPNQKVVNVKGLHFLQEDSNNEIGLAIKKFLQDSVFWLRYWKWLSMIVMESNYFANLFLITLLCRKIILALLLSDKLIVFYVVLRSIARYAKCCNYGNYHRNSIKFL